MYPYLWLRFRKFLKGAWNRYVSSKRERTTSLSSLQECLDHQTDRKGLWNNWFLLLLIAPLFYYVIFIRGLWEDDFSSNHASRSMSESLSISTHEDVTIPKPYETLPYETENVKIRHRNDVQGKDAEQLYHNNNTKNKKSNGSFYQFVSQLVEKSSRNDNNNYNTGTSLPWCVYRLNNASDTEVKFQNISVSELVKIGGSYSPERCRSRHKVAVIVPYRDRQINLAVFLFTIHPFLINQNLDYRIFVVEQSGTELFNKGRLFNSGYVEAIKLRHWDCLIFHDVDLLPISTLILYSCPIWPRHMCPTVVENGKNLWNFHTYFGGVSSMTTKHFVTVNGYSNLYWGWGGEDTDMFWRIKGAGFPLVRYNKNIARYLILPHQRIPECQNRNELMKTALHRYPYDGLTTLQYKVVSIKLLHLYTHILVDINPSSNNVTTSREN